MAVLLQMNLTTGTFEKLGKIRWKTPEPESLFK